MQIQSQTYIIVATTNDDLYTNYELYRCSRSFTISLFVLHSTPLYHIDSDHEVNPHHLSCERTRLLICLKTCTYTIQHIVIIIRLQLRQIDLQFIRNHSFHNSPIGPPAFLYPHELQKNGNVNFSTRKVKKKGESTFRPDDNKYQTILHSNQTAITS